jgi:ADP-dependent NAD(P)H-hydrate dehydratase / NAD(P)H-hydrate epimerase
VGKLLYANFGLGATYSEQAQATMELITPDMAASWLPSIQRNRHKYQAGHVVGLAGSPGFTGAAILSSFAALRGGAGIVHLLFPNGMESDLGSAPAELIKIPYQLTDDDSILGWMNKANAVFIGPGMGRDDSTKKLLKNLLPRIPKPCVIDADALTIIAEERIPIPSQAILTPHAGELQRLFHDESHPVLDEAYLRRCQSFAEDHAVTLVLKGGPSFIFHPGKPILVNPTGNPGMATAGSGDVLTGLIAALLAQGLGCREAAALGVYLHGLAGDFGAETKTDYCLVASDITEHFPEAFKTITKPRC